MTIRVGIGGWTYAPWRGTFYPAGLPHTRELDYASRRLTTIEVNGTFYGTMSAKTYRSWHDATPDGFVFALKGPRYAVNRRVLAEAGESIDRFVASGIAELGAKLGPILWQFAGTKRFDAADMAAFVRLLPARAGDVPLRHALEPRHASFDHPDFTAIAREAGAAIVFADSDDYPLIGGSAADFTYARLQRGDAAEPAGYPPGALDGWAAQAHDWGQGGDAFVYFIHGGKVRAPAAAMALIERL